MATKFVHTIASYKACIDSLRGSCSEVNFGNEKEKNLLVASLKNNPGHFSLFVKEMR